MDQETINQLRLYPLLTVSDVPVQLIASSEYNPRKFRDDAAKESLKQSLKADPDFMRVRPIIVNMFEGREGVIIAGDKRFISAAELEWPTVPVVFVSVPIEKEKAWNLKDNIHQGEWDVAKRKDLVMELRDMGMDMGSIGYTGGEIVDIMGGVQLSGEGDHKNDPNYNGTTPRKKAKVKIAEGAELECPNCHSTFTYGVKAEMTGEQ